MNRFELNKKYYIYGKPANKKSGKQDMIVYYRNYQKVLNNLLVDLNGIEKVSIEERELNFK